MLDYPRPCPKCGALTEEEGFNRDRTQSSGRRRICRGCDGKKSAAYYEAHREEIQASKLSAHLAAREAEWEAGREEREARLEARLKAHAAGEARQKALLDQIEAERGIKLRA